MSDREHPLAKQLDLGMDDLGWVSGVGDGSIHAVHQAGAQVDLAKQKTTGVGGDPTAVEPDDDFLGTEACEAQLLMTDCRHGHTSGYVLIPRKINTLEGARSFV